MRTYHQYCPIARASEILAERWTPIILRNLHHGATTFNSIAAGAPGLSTALLTKRLRELKRAGVVAIDPKPEGHGKLYQLTEAGNDAFRVIKALGEWGDKWTEVLDEHAHVGNILWSWSEVYMRREALPDRHVQVRFEYIDPRGRKNTDWLLVEAGGMEVCRFDPGFGDDVVVLIHQPVLFARWHIGQADWRAVLSQGGVELRGDSKLCRQLPTWNAAPEVYAQRRARLAREAS